MPFDPIIHVRLYHAAINAFDFKTIGDCFAQDAVYASKGIGEIAGREAIVKAFQSYFAIYPDQVAKDDLIEALSPRSARALWRLTATHVETGELYTRSGEETIFFDEGGKISRVDVHDD
jgi:ketosteroid isomerase-like protein